MAAALHVVDCGCRAGSWSFCFGSARRTGSLNIAATLPIYVVSAAEARRPWNLHGICLADDKAQKRRLSNACMHTGGLPWGPVGWF